MTRSNASNTPNYPPQTKPSAAGREEAESMDLVDSMEHGKQSTTDGAQSTSRDAEGKNRAPQGLPQDKATDKPEGGCGCG